MAIDSVHVVPPRKNPVFTSLHLKSPVHGVPPLAGCQWEQRESYHTSTIFSPRSFL